MTPWVRERSAGESWSASRLEPPTKQKFQPRPSKNSDTASGTTCGDNGAKRHESSSVSRPRQNNRRAPPAVGQPPPTRPKKAYIPSVCDEITADTLPSAWSVVRHVQGGNHHQHDHHGLTEDHRRHRRDDGGLPEDDLQRSRRPGVRFPFHQRPARADAPRRAGRGAVAQRRLEALTRTSRRSPRTPPVSSGKPNRRLSTPIGPTRSGPMMAPTVPPSTTFEMARPRSSGRTYLSRRETSQLQGRLRAAHQRQPQQQQPKRTLHDGPRRHE